MSLHASAVETLTSWQAPDPGQDTLRHAVLSFSGRPPRRVPARVRARPHHRLGTGSRPHRNPGAAHPAPAVRAVAATRRALRTDRRRHRRGRAAGSHRGIRHRRPENRSGTGGAACPPRHLLAGGAHPSPRHAVHRARPAESAEIACSDESLELRWWRLDELPGDCDFGLTQLAAAARRYQTSVE